MNLYAIILGDLFTISDNKITQRSRKSEGQWVVVESPYRDFWYELTLTPIEPTPAVPYPHYMRSNEVYGQNNDFSTENLINDFLYKVRFFETIEDAEQHERTFSKIQRIKELEE